MSLLARSKRYVDDPSSMLDFSTDKWAVLLLNMGGPQSLDQVPEYLFNIFSDRNIIKLPMSRILQRPLAKLISSRRSGKVAEHYKEIGGGSPLLRVTEAQASSLKTELRRKFANVEVLVGMRYTRPSIREALNRASRMGCRHVILLPLYPQYSLATTGTAFLEALKWLDNDDSDLILSAIDDWHDHSDYIPILRDRIQSGIDEMPGDGDVRVLFSAHSLPQSMVDGGDPYVAQTRTTVKLAGGGFDHSLSFQSRSGPVKWVGPETIAEVRRLAGQGVKRLLIVPVSFVSDHIETLHEIDIELKGIALSAGIKHFARTRSFNDDSDFINCLLRIVVEKIHTAGETEQ